MKRTNSREDPGSVQASTHVHSRQQENDRHHGLYVQGNGRGQVDPRRETKVHK